MTPAMPTSEPGGRGALHVRAAAVVFDPDGMSAVLALTPANRCLSPLTSRHSSTWSAVTVLLTDGGTIHEVLRTLVTEQSTVQLAGITEGIWLVGGGLDLRLPVAGTVG